MIGLSPKRGRQKAAIDQESQLASQKQTPHPLCLASVRRISKPDAIGFVTVACIVFGIWMASTANAHGSRARSEPTGHTARTTSATDTAHLHLIKTSGEEITEEGHASGTIPGTVKAFLNVGPTVVAKFTIYPRSGGSISGEGSGKLKGGAEEPSFAGHMIVSRGTGRYAHVHGKGGFYGTLNRRSYALTVQTIGTISY